MRHMITGQALLIVCCIFYMIWWYRGYQPNVEADRIGGLNGCLLLITAVLGVSGILFSLMPTPETVGTKYRQMYIIVGGIAAYIILMMITKYVFGRIVTSELFLIVGWTMLELSLLNRLSGSGLLSGTKLLIVYVSIVLAFITSMVLYVAYYRMEDNAAFYSAMIPLVTEAVSMGVLIMMIFK
ncbi:MAG: hypothetical protein K6E53_09855 [Lachnospiraceae bacterium]|nr:hypothetical protein [Lachnospiraceae bacterium]